MGARTAPRPHRAAQVGPRQGEGRVAPPEPRTHLPPNRTEPRAHYIVKGQCNLGALVFFYLRSRRTGAVVDPMRGQSDHSRTPVLLTFLVRFPSVTATGSGGSGGGCIDSRFARVWAVSATRRKIILREFEIVALERRASPVCSDSLADSRLMLYEPRHPTAIS